ncbi:hypothetical protein NUACC21_74330 [Scytonema sp. NUACC21]
MAANEDLDRIVTAWEQQTYKLLPWTLQVALLVREVFSSSVVMYELETGDLKRYRELLVKKILAKSKQLQPPNGCSLADLLDDSWKEIKNNDELELATGLLEVRSVPKERLVNTPHLFVIGTMLELATLPEKARELKLLSKNLNYFLESLNKDAALLRYNCRICVWRVFSNNSLRLLIF